MAVDALQAVWDPTMYSFPPVPFIAKVLQKVELKRAEAVLVCPQWPSGLWWTLVLEMLVSRNYPYHTRGHA